MPQTLQQGHCLSVKLTRFSACMSSVLRTYYTWRIVQSPDVSYYMIPMGLWTYAEISTGVFISCVPVMPRFFQHVVPKMTRAMTTRSIFTKSSAGRSVDEPHLAAAPKHTRSLPTNSAFWTRSSTSGDVYDSHPSRPEEYVVLHDDVSGTPASRFQELQHLPEANFARTRHDLEGAH